MNLSNLSEDKLTCSALLAANANSFGFSSPLATRSSKSLLFESEAIVFDSANLASISPNDLNTSFDIFMAIIAMNTKYIKLIIFCLADTFPPAILVCFLLVIDY